ncbi:hypothetical protein SAMN04488021_1824 [Paracoccus aminovorans]|uniref:Uncharacterized protein n=1 Tax=Paracoccus aminovorans TaxID=34004 RepID=A0A1I3FL60_9RHOB|nr:hypothetical protein JCM7685_2260 [Paracoccus aminovorans]SFI11949.1 hypothetical protein SAMN04488021_1824 [Paracoccus aminovorans]
MRLAKIEIENFKGIGNRQVVDLKPITLLFVSIGIQTGPLIGVQK